MNTAHWHLILNHFPIIGTLGAIVVLIYGWARKNNDTSLLGLILLAAMAVMSVVVMQTGEGAEELVEKLPGVSEAALEAHEEAAKVANILLIVSGVLALVAASLQIRKHRLQSAARMLTLLLALIAFGAMGYTGYLGGKIRHTEIQSGGANSSAPATADTGADDED